MRRAGVVALVALVLAALVPLHRVAAQDSPLSIRGLGMPGRPESARSRATGGAFAAFDPISALTEASLARATRLTATAAGATSFMHEDIGGERDSRRTARLGLFQVIGSLGHGFVAAGGFSTYLDRSYDIIIVDTIMLGGSAQSVTDELGSDGGVTDVRFALSRRLGPLALGAGYHLLTGSTRVSARRTFSDTSVYANVSQLDEVAYHAQGVSASAVLTVGSNLAVVGYWRSDTRLTSEVGARTVAVNDLPHTVGGGLRWAPSPAVNLAASWQRRSWASAADSDAYNTSTWASGAEIRLGAVPLRIGVRGGDVPFGPGGKAPREFTLALGSGLTLSDGRGVLDLALERQRRTTTGFSETGWTAIIGVTLRP